MLLKKSRDFTLTRQGFYAKESNAPQTFYAEIRRAAGLKQPAQKQQTSGGARGGQRVPASLQTPALASRPKGLKGRV